MAGNIIADVDALLRASRFAEAAKALAAAAGAGHSEAQVALAHWHIAGNIIPRDLAAAREMLGRAAAGDRGAALLHLYFLASGVGGPAEWPAALAALRKLARHDREAAAQLRLVERMDLTPEGFPAAAHETRQLIEAPHIVACEAFLTAAECAYLIEAREPALQPSLVVDPASGQMVPNPIRRSDAAIFGVHDEDLVVNAINRRIAALSGTTLRQGEPLQLLRYRPGGEYRAHMDALPPGQNQRGITVLLYLNEAYRGGETQFPRLGLSFRGRTGDALLFHNVRANGEADPMTLHAGLPVEQGTKLIATRWIRQGDFTYPPPQPILAAPR